MAILETITNLKPIKTTLARARDLLFLHYSNVSLAFMCYNNHDGQRRCPRPHNLSSRFAGCYSPRLNKISSQESACSSLIQFRPRGSWKDSQNLRYWSSAVTRLTNSFSSCLHDDRLTLHHLVLNPMTALDTSKQLSKRLKYSQRTDASVRLYKPGLRPP